MKPIPLILALLLCFTLCPATVADSGTTAPQPTPQTFTSDDYEYILLVDGSAKITKYLGWDEGHLVIPSTLDGIPVTQIGTDAFPWRKMTKITIPDSVTTICDSAFSDCRCLKTITIPDSVVSVGNNPFLLCGALTTINVSPNHPTLAVIDNVLFEKNSNKLVCYPLGKNGTSYTVPQGTQCIGDNAFTSADLTGITIPESVTTIGDYAFSYSDLARIIIPNSVVSMGSNPFSCCLNLTFINVSPDHPTLAVIDDVLFEKSGKKLICYPAGKVKIKYSSYKIPQGIQRIGDNAFYDCKKLEKVTIPDSVTAIGKEAFLLCEKLSDLTIPDSVTAIGEKAFSACGKLVVTVSRDSYAAQYCKDNNVPFTYSDGDDWLNH